MADAIKGNITIESGSVDKAAASIEALNASLKDTLKTAKAVNAEMKKTSAAKSGKSGKSATSAVTGKSSGASTAENSLKATNITKFSNSFGTALTNSIKIKDNFIETGKITTQIKNEFAAMLKKVTTANAKVVGTKTSGGNGGGIGKATERQLNGVWNQYAREVDYQRRITDRDAFYQRKRDDKYSDELLKRAQRDIEKQEANVLYERRRADRNADYERRLADRNAQYERRLADRNAQYERQVSERLAADNRKFAQQNTLEGSKQSGRIQLEGVRHSNRVQMYERKRSDMLRDREARERAGSFRRNYYAERQFDMVRDQFIGHGFGTSFGVFKNLGGIARQKFFDWYVNRQSGLLGLDPKDPDYQLKRSGIMHDLVNRGGGIGRVVGLITGTLFQVGNVFVKIALIIAKVIAQIHIMGTAIGGLITAIGAATAAQEYDRYRAQMTKLMLSHDMFANNTILPFDSKAKHDYVNANYGLAHYITNEYGMRGLDTIESGIRLAHLVGVGEGGGFKTDDEAMNFARGLAAAAQVNGMSDSEVQTLQYQGAQIASKGYAELMDIKPLMNSAPGIINDLIKFTGMSREELLKSGKTRALTWEKFKEMFVTNRSYYETLAGRRDTQTIGGQFQTAKQAFGLGVMGVSSSGIAEGGTKDIMQELAGSDLILLVGQMLGKIAGDFVKFFVMMFADEGDKSIRGAITNFGLTVIDFLGETAHIVVDLIGNVRLVWHTFGESFKGIIRFLANIPPIKGALEATLGRKLPEWALSDYADSGEKYVVNARGGGTVVFGGDMKTKRLLDKMEKAEYAKEKERVTNEIANVTKQANVISGMAAKGNAPKWFATGVTWAAEEAVNALQMQHKYFKVDRQKLGQRAYDTAMYLDRDKLNSGLLTDHTDKRSLFSNELVIAGTDAMNAVLEELGVRQTKDTINAQTDQVHKEINDAVTETKEKYQMRGDIPSNRTTNDLLNEIANNTGKGKAALDRVTDVLVEFTKNRVINNITRVRPNVVVNFGDISDVSSINFAMSEMTSKLKNTIENIAGEDTVTLQIGATNG